MATQRGTRSARRGAAANAKRGTAGKAARAKRRTKTAKVAPKRVKKTTRRAAAKPARKSARTKRGTKTARAAPKRVKKTTRRAAAKPARKSARKAAAKRAPGAAPVLRVVRRPAPRPPAAPAPPVPQAFAGARAGATARELLLFDLERARVSLHAALHGLTAAGAEVPMAPGKWSPRQLALHLVFWDRAVLPWIEPAYRRNERMPFDRSRLHENNAAGLATLDHHTWDEAWRLLHESRGAVREAFEAIPEEPEEVWGETHALGGLIRILAWHDRHHADQLKAARVTAPR
jgi:hypothetical protein